VFEGEPGVGDNPLPDSPLDVVHVRLCHHIESEEKGEEWNEKAVRNVDPSLERKEGFVARIRCEPFREFGPSLVEDYINVGVPANVCPEISSEAGLFDTGPLAREGRNKKLPVVNRGNEGGLVQISPHTRGLGELVD